MLVRYPVAIVKPRSLDLSRLLQRYPRLQVEAFPDDYFDGIAAYNRLMLSPLFYERFLQFEYILVYQLDAYVFRDDLERWCSAGHDYLGAPWIPRGRFYKTVRYAFNSLIGINKRIPWRMIRYRVGNGGFSLRAVRAFHDIARKEQTLVQTYTRPTSGSREFLPEDLFWAIEPQRKGYSFAVPGYKEALLFSFDKYPAQCWKITRTLPFGCHAWNRKKHFRFWKKYIPVDIPPNTPSS